MLGFDVLDYTWLIPTFPFLAFLAILLFGKQDYPTFKGGERGGAIAALGVGLAAILSIMTAWQVLVKDVLHDEHYIQKERVWFEGNTFAFDVGTYVDALAAMMLFVVGTISFLVIIFSMGYMAGEGDRRVRYFAEISLFVSVMLGLVVSNSLLLLFIFWELVGVTSYLLIGFWFNRSSAAIAAKKAFIMTRFGDFGFLFSIIYLFNFNPASLDIIELYKMIEAGAISTKIATIASLGFLFGAIGKSAQFPLHSWLPDAMEGPTSVSALIHSATMVTAGVFLIARLFPLFDHSQLMILIASIGAITSLIAATMGLTSTDIKRVLAYSTISQLGYMVMALGLGAYSAAIFHLFTHAFFKAGLFLCAGSVHHASGTFNMKFMGGLQSKMKLTYYSMLICGVSLAGIFPLSGFWSKDEIILSTFNHGGFIGYLFLLIGLIVAFMTAFYMFRTISLTFYGSFRGGGDEERKVLQSNNIEVPETVQNVHLEESPKFMTYPLIVLSFFAIFIGYVVNPVFSDLIFINKHAFSEFVEKSLEIYHYHGTHSFNFSIALLSTFMALIGSLFALNAYKSKTEIYKNSLMRKINYFLDKKYFIDYLYEKVIVENIFYETICKSVAWIDNNIFDQINLFKKAKVIIGYHGAGFANLVFSHPKTKVVEIHPHPEVEFRDDIKVISDIKQLEHKFFFVDYKSNIENSNNMTYFDGIVDISKFNLGKYDLIVSNPPYIPTREMRNLSKDITNYEPMIALNGGKDGLDLIKKVIYKSNYLLKKNGMLAIEIGNNQYRRVSYVLRRQGFKEIGKECDYDRNVRCIISTKMNFF